MFALLPALAEETFFRGVMLKGSSRKVVHGILITSVCFALYHGNVTQLIYQFIYGVILSFLAIKAKSVLPCLVAHFINNFAILLLEYLKVSIDLYNGVTIALGLMLLAVFWTGIILHKRSVNTFAYKEITLTPTHGFTYGIVAIMIYVVLMIANLFA